GSPPGPPRWGRCSSRDAVAAREDDNRRPQGRPEREADLRGAPARLPGTEGIVAAAPDGPEPRLPAGSLRRLEAYPRPHRFRFRHRVVESIPKRVAASTSVVDSASTRCTWARSTSSSEPGTVATNGAGRSAVDAST